MVGVVVGDGGDGDLGLFDGGEVAAQHPAVAVERLAGVDGERLAAAHEVDVGGLRAHGALVGDLDGADAGGDLHGIAPVAAGRTDGRAAYAPGRSRTCGLAFRRRLLSSAELRGRVGDHCTGGGR